MRLRSLLLFAFKLLNFWYCTEKLLRGAPDRSRAVVCSSIDNCSAMFRSPLDMHSDALIAISLEMVAEFLESEQTTWGCDSRVELRTN